MKKKIHLLFLLLAVSLNQFAQDLTYVNNTKEAIMEGTIKELPVFEFNGYSWNSELENISKDMAGEHPFGDMVAKKVYLLNKKYTYEEVISPGNPQTKTIIKKPVIYEAVKHIERYLKKSLKKGETTLVASTNDFNKILDVALNILTADTRNFETAIKALKDDPAKIKLFTKGVTLLY